MSNIKFEKTSDNKLILTYFPVLESMEHFKSRLPSFLRNCFYINTSILYGDINDDIDEITGISFCVGDIESNYIKLDSNVFKTEHNFFISKEISIKSEYFVTHNNISILKKIDKIIEEDVYIGGSNHKAIPFETFKVLIDNFPNTTELKKYSRQRISTILKEYFPYTEKYEKKFDNHIFKKNQKIENSSGINKNLKFIENIKLNLIQFEKLEKDFLELLDKVSDEKSWQIYILQLLQLMFPQYIQVIREVRIKNVDGDKIPDFMLIDFNGYVDLLEIKKPQTRIMRDTPIHRNNYIPTLNFTETVQQIEKYIYYLNRWGEEGEKKLNEKYRNDLIEGISIKIINPKGFLILGRNSEFDGNPFKKKDFELVKRQFKNIFEILTYDDLLSQLRNIIKSLKYSLKNIENKN